MRLWNGSCAGSSLIGLSYVRPSDFHVIWLKSDGETALKYVGSRGVGPRAQFLVKCLKWSTEVVLSCGLPAREGWPFRPCSAPNLLLRLFQNSFLRCRGRS